jgi:hypothetical protein
MRMIDASNDLSTIYTISTQAPTPDYPQNIRVVTGDNEVVVSNSDNTQSQTTTLHLGSNYLAGIGDYKDQIVKDGDNWKIVRNIGKQIVDGTVNFLTYLTVSGNIIQTSFALSCKNRNAICDRFPVTQGYSATEHFVIAAALTAGLFHIDKTRFESDDIAGLKKWFSENNTLLYYVLPIPTEETITDTTLINDLNKLQELLSYDGTTNITITSEDTNAQMTAEVTYTSESDMCEKLLFIFNKMKDKLYHIIRSL